MNKLDIIVPILNEADNLPHLLSRIKLAFVGAKIDYRVILIDDHSTDNTKEVVKTLVKKYPIEFRNKSGKKGKAHSIIEGVKLSNTEYFAMIDGDLQYPPEAIPEMFKLAKENDLGVVVGNRVYQKIGRVRSFVSKAGRFIVGKLVTGLSRDTQSGLKVIKREIIEHVDLRHVYPWSIDVPVLHTAKDLGYEIGSVDIPFSLRENGVSKVNLLKATLQIVGGALKQKLYPKKVYHLKPENLGNMLGAGIIYKKKKFLTHTTLNHTNSAIVTFTRFQKAFILSIFAVFATLLFLFTKSTLIGFVAVLSAIYFADVFFNLYLVLKSLHFPPELHFEEEDLKSIKDRDLPVYTILCPMYKEANILPQFVESIDKLDYPKSKLEVLLLLEEDDIETIKKAKDLKLESHFKVIVVPHSFPKTKPKACNYGLAHTTGEYVVIYDAEDIPDPDQLKKSVLGFRKLGTGYSCLQAKLNYHNPNQNWLTRLFTTEYSLWFDVMLPALQTVNTFIPLGGTSNHFRTSDLNKFEGWDPFNVTEDADLGVRLFRAGGKTAIIDSMTYEEANSNLKNWIRQRSRWIKGYLQTYLVHMRNPFDLAKKFKGHFVIFQLVAGLRMTFMIINPILWILTLSYFLLYQFVGPQIEALYPSAIFYMAITSAIFGNFLYVYYYMIGTAKHGQYQLIKYVFLVPLYWFFTSIAACMAFWQLFTKPHYWEKTIHGLLKVKNKNKINFNLNFSIKSLSSMLSNKISDPSFKSGAILIIATVVNYLFNFLYNAFLGRELKSIDFGTISFFGSLLYVLSLVTSGLSRTVTFKSAFLSGKYGSPQKTFWKKISKKSLFVSISMTIIWLILTPLLQHYFKIEYIYTLFLFAPVIIISITNSVNEGFLNGNHKFSVIAIMISVEALTKFIFSYIFVRAGLNNLVVASLPLSLLSSLLVSSLFIRNINSKSGKSKITSHDNIFPAGFFVTSILARLSSVGFLSFDLLLAKRYLTPIEAGEYALIALVGKMIFFSGSIFNQFITPLVSKSEGSKKDSLKIFYRMLIITLFACLASYLFFGYFGYITAPVLLGDKILPVVKLLPIFGIGMIFFTLSESFIPYHIVKGHKIFPMVGILMSLVQVFAFSHFHQGLESVVYIMTSLGLLYFCLVVILHFNINYFKILQFNFNDFVGLFKRQKRVGVKNGKLKILIFNWRDTKHVWAGGAEVYVHEIAKRLVEKGNLVTIFCGNDTKNPRNEVIDGVQIVRRGGFYTVYLWAFLYYVLRFRGKYDIVVDNENGIPFFTPFYVKEPVVGLIHHVHQEVILKELMLPKYLLPVGMLATFLERYAMPFAYRNCQMVTVSESSKKDMIKIGFGVNMPIKIINPGVTLSDYKKRSKTKKPSLLYLGRLKPYKSIDTVISAVKYLTKYFPDLSFKIAGTGESRVSLEKLVTNLGLEKNIEFLGKVTEKEKIKLMSSAWVFVYPSTFEGWGISVIEANASGTPVVASNVAGLRDSVNNGYSGFLVKSKNVTNFTNKIKNLLEDHKLRNSMSNNSIDWASNYDWNISADRFADCLFDSLNNDNSVDYTTSDLEVSID